MFKIHSFFIIADIITMFNSMLQNQLKINDFKYIYKFLKLNYVHFYLPLKYIKMIIEFIFDILQQIYSMKVRPSTAKSKIQTSFETKQVFKRNKNYIDLEHTNHDKQYSILRRMPLKSEGHHINQKINHSFLNTTATLTQRSQQTVTKHRSRGSFVEPHMTSQRETLEPSNQKRTQKLYKKSRSFSFDKMTSRQYHHNIKYKQVPDERRFNNFKPFQVGPPIFCDFSKMRGKQMNYQQKPKEPQLQYNTQKLYQQYYLNKGEQNCRVDYKSQKKLKKQRVFFSPKRPQNCPATQLDLQKIENAQKNLTHYKNGNLKKKSKQIFYLTNERERPSQIQLRYMNELNNYWEGVSDDQKQEKIKDYYNKKAKQQFQNEGIRKIKFHKEVKHNRQQMCQQFFFRRFKF